MHAKFLSSSPLRILIGFLICILFSTTAVAILYAGEHLLFPAAIEPAAHWIYRAVFWAMLPLRTVAAVLTPERGHHWPPWHWAFLLAAGPLYIGGLGWAARELGRRLGLLQRRENASGKPKSANDEAPDLDRRRLLKGAATGMGGAACAGLGGWSVYVEPNILQVRRYTIRIRNLPTTLNGLRVVHAGDTHYGPLITMRYLEQAMDAINALEPDLMLLTGDYVHRTPAAIERGIGVLGRLRPRLGTVAVLGNHDYWEGAAACRERFAEIGIPLVDNDRLFLDPEGKLTEDPPTEGLCLAGLEDFWEGEPDLERALRDVPDAMPRLVLEHNPDILLTAPFDHRVDLLLCGHTHGGQVKFPVIGPPILPIDAGPQYEGGLVEGPHARVLVTRGIGMAFLPVRFNVPPEFSLVTLRRV